RRRAPSPRRRRARRSRRGRPPRAGRRPPARRHRARSRRAPSRPTPAARSPRPPRFDPARRAAGRRSCPRSDHEAGVAPPEPLLHLVALRLEARTAHEPVREPLPLLDARLPERVDPGERPDGRRRRLEEVEDLSERESVHGGQRERRARAAALRERELRRALLRVQELPERVPSEIREAREVLVARRDVDGLAVILDAEEEDDLVARALGPELELGVLVGGADGPDGRLPPLDRPPLEVDRLAEALGPELAEPVARRRETVAVGHHHDD